MITNYFTLTFKKNFLKIRFTPTAKKPLKTVKIYTTVFMVFNWYTANNLQNVSNIDDSTSE